MALNNGNVAQPGQQIADDDTFDSYLQEIQQINNVPRCHLRVFNKHPKLRTSTWCAHCKQHENVPLYTVKPPDHTAVSLSVAPYELAVGGASCSTCAREIYEKIRNLRNAAPAGSAGNTPFHHAARSGNLRMLFNLVTLLGLEAGYDRVVEVLRKTNDRGETALHVAVSVRDKDMVNLLVWLDDKRLGDALRVDTSLIYLAVSQGVKDIAQKLHDAFGHGANNDFYSGPSGQNALHAAVLHGEGMTRMVLGWKKNDLSTKKDQDGSTPLHFAVSMKQRTYIPKWCFHTWFRNIPTEFQKKIVKVPVWPLLDAEPSVAYQADNEGLLPVHVAAIRDGMVAVHILLTERPCCMGLRDNQGRTFLHVAVQYKGLSVVRYACRRPDCASIMNVQDNNGNTALHLAVGAENLWIFCELLANRAVCLNLRNNMGQTALDLAASNIREGFFYRQNRDKLIHSTLGRVGAKHSSCRGKMLRVKQGSGAKTEETRAGELDKEESAKLTDGSRTLAIGSVLIATMTFSATFARLPGGYKADPATAVAANRWCLDAFVVASGLAFILSSVATVGVMYSGMAMVELPIRQKHFRVSLFFASSSVTCLTIAFALGVYIVLAPVSYVSTGVICAISPLLLIYRNSERLQRRLAVSRPVRARKGFWVWLRWTVCVISAWMVTEFWPFVLIFAWVFLEGHLTRQLQQHG